MLRFYLESATTLERSTSEVRFVLRMSVIWKALDLW